MFRRFKTLDKYSVLAVVLAVTGLICGFFGVAASAADAKTSAANVKLPKLVDLGAAKCIPCKMLAPILEELTREYAGVLTVEFIDVWQQENVDNAQHYRIESIPTQIFLDADGKELWRHEGFITKAELVVKWKELGYDLDKRKQERTAGK